jgi:hypothetical protein
MFRAAQCSSSGESTVPIQLLVYVTLCRWPSSVRVGKFLPDLHTRRSPTQCDIYQKLYWYNWFSWSWTLRCSKHVENWNKRIRKKNCVSSWLFTRINGSCQVCGLGLCNNVYSFMWRHIFGERILITDINPGGSISCEVLVYCKTTRRQYPEGHS